MAQPNQSTSTTSSDLVTRYKALKAEEPRLFARDAAHRLGVSEGELIAARCGSDVVRLDDRWPELITAMPTVGRIMSLTRNDWAVHERKGCFETVRTGPHGGIVLGPDIDLRIRFDVWGSGFEVTDQTAHGERRSFQFFDKTGTAVQKIYQQSESDNTAWDKIVDSHRSDDQTPGLTVLPAILAEPEQPASPPDIAALQADWRAMTDVHQFFGLLRKHAVDRVDCFRLVGTEFAVELNNSSFPDAMREAAKQNIPVMIFVTNPGMVQVHTGPVRNIKQVGDWFNVLDPDFNLHLLPEGIASTWLVRKPTRDGTVTSIETFDAENRQITWMFGERGEGNEERGDWRRLAGSFGQKTVA